MRNERNNPVPAHSSDHVTARFSAEESPSEAVVRALAAVEDVEPTDLDVFYEAIEPDALDELLGGPASGADTTPIAVEFVASGHRVVVRNDGCITIRDGNTGGGVASSRR